MKKNKDFYNIKMLLHPAQDIQRLVAEHLLFDPRLSDSDIYQLLRQRVDPHNNFFLTLTFKELLNQRAKYIYHTYYSSNEEFLRKYYRSAKGYDYHKAVADITILFPTFSDISTSNVMTSIIAGTRLSRILTNGFDLMFQQEFPQVLHILTIAITFIPDATRVFRIVNIIFKDTRAYIANEQIGQLLMTVKQSGLEANIITMDLYDTLYYSQLQTIVATTDWSELREALQVDLTAPVTLTSIILEDNLSAFITITSKHKMIPNEHLFVDCYRHAARQIYHYLRTLTDEDYWSVENYRALLQNYTSKAEVFLDSIVGINDKFPYTFELFGGTDDLANIRYDHLVNFVALPRHVTFSMFLRHYQSGDNDSLSENSTEWPQLIFQGWVTVKISAFEIVDLVRNQTLASYNNNILFQLFDVNRFGETAYRDYFLFVFNELITTSNTKYSSLATSANHMILYYFYFYCMRGDRDLPIYPAVLYYERSTTVSQLPLTPLARFIFIDANNKISLTINNEKYKSDRQTMFYSPANTAVSFASPSSITIWEMPSDVARYLSAVRLGYGHTIKDLSQ